MDKEVKSIENAGHGCPGSNVYTRGVCLHGDKTQQVLIMDKAAGAVTLILSVLYVSSSLCVLFPHIYHVAVICGQFRNTAEGSKRRSHNPLRVSYLFLRYVFKNRVLRECVRFCSICITVSMLFIGIQKKELCPFEPAIPVFLLVDGSILVLHTGISALRLCVEKKKSSDPDINRLDNTSILLKILVLFLVLWNLAGSVWIYSAEKIVQFHDSIRTTYCDVTAYYFAFGLVTSAYIVVGLIIVFVLLTVTSLYIYQTCTRTPFRGGQDEGTDQPDSITHI